MKINNHYIPYFHIKKWESIGGRIYDKKKQGSRKIRRLDFSKKNYYSDDGTDTLENRIEKFESYISKLIVKLDNTSKKIKFTGKELFLLKLYCLLCAYRQENTTEVINHDDFDSYQSNKYLVGTFNLGKKDVIPVTKKIMDLFDTIINDSSFKHLENFSSFSHYRGDTYNSYLVMQLQKLHISILRSDSMDFAISDIFAIIENTIDSDHLYTYIPVSPKTALLLVKTKYYLNNFTLNQSKIRLARKNGSSKPDPYLSEIFGLGDEKGLLCSYYKPYIQSKVHSAPGMLLPNDDYSFVEIKIYLVDTKISSIFNSIMYEDSRLFIYTNNKQLKIVQHLEFEGRKILGI